jgi:hypothetical protein
MGTTAIWRPLGGLLSPACSPETASFANSTPKRHALRTPDGRDCLALPTAFGQSGHPCTDAEMDPERSGRRRPPQPLVEPRGCFLWIPNAELATWIGIGGLDDPPEQRARIVVMEQGTSSDLPDPSGTSPRGTKPRHQPQRHAAPEAPAPEAPAPEAPSPGGRQPQTRQARCSLWSAAARLLWKNSCRGRMLSEALEVGDENLAVAGYGRRDPAARLQGVAAQRAGTRIKNSVVAPPSVAAGQVVVVDLTLGGEWTAGAGGFRSVWWMRPAIRSPRTTRWWDRPSPPQACLSPGTAAGRSRLVGLFVRSAELPAVGRGRAYG